MAKHVDYYLSLNSPWAYLASKRFEVDRQEARRRRDDLAGRFRLGVLGLRRPASARSARRSARPTA